MYQCVLKCSVNRTWCTQMSTLTDLYCLLKKKRKKRKPSFFFDNGLQCRVWKQCISCMKVVNVFGLQRFAAVKATLTCSFSLLVQFYSCIPKPLDSLFLSSVANSAQTVTRHGKDGGKWAGVWWIGILDEQEGGRVSRGDKSLLVSSMAQYFI